VAETFYGGQVVLHAGDCTEVLAGLDDASVDAVVTDPPYGLEFMGREWDGADGFRRSLNPGDAGRDNVSGRTTRTSPQYSTGAGQRGKPGIGERHTDWVSNQGWNGFRCRSCGHLSHGGSPCQCDAPDFARADDRWHLYQQWCEAWAAECLRVLKPGGHLLAFGGTRTYHRMTCAIEDAGFEVRDSIHWLYGSGFLPSPSHWTYPRRSTKLPGQNGKWRA
jgi:DNA modification methylase